MRGSNDNVGDIGLEVIIDALARWCVETDSEPNQMLMVQAIELYNRGNDTSDELLTALRKLLTQ